MSVSSVHGGETCMFDWDAYMEQVSKLMHHEPTRDVASGLDAVVAMGGSVDVMGSWPTWNFNYTELKGDTGPLVYPALHTWIHSALFVVSGWDARRWTTETTPKNMSGYEERTHRPAELLRNIQYGYVGLHMATLACVLGVMAAAGLLSPMGQVEDSADGSAGNAAPSASLLQRLAAGLLAFLRAQGPAVVTCALLSLSQRVRNTSVAGLFNDSWAMLLAHGCVLALVHRRFLTGCLLLSAGVAVKMNVLLLAPGVLYVLLAEGGIAFAAQHIAACGALQLLLAAPFLAAAPMEYLRRAFDLGRKFDQQWSVNWNFLPAGLFGSGLFAAALLALQVSLLLAFALSLWRAQHLPIAAVDAAANGILKPLKTIDAAGTAAAVGIAGEDRDVGAAGAVAPARTPTADPESIADNDGDADSDVTPSAANNSRLQHLRERPRGGGSTPASTASPAATRASPRDGATLTSASRTGSSSVPAFPADRGRAGPWPALKWSWARGASAPLTAQGALPRRLVAELLHLSLNRAALVCCACLSCTSAPLPSLPLFMPRLPPASLSRSPPPLSPRPSPLPLPLPVQASPWRCTAATCWALRARAPCTSSSSHGTSTACPCCCASRAGPGPPTSPLWWPSRSAGATTRPRAGAAASSRLCILRSWRPCGSLAGVLQRRMRRTRLRARGCYAQCELLWLLQGSSAAVQLTIPIPIPILVLTASCRSSSLPLLRRSALGLPRV